MASNSSDTRSVFLRRGAAATAAFAGGLGVRSVAAAATTAVSLGTFPIDPMSVAYYAKDQGYFARAGLDVTITPFGGGAGAGIAASVATGALDIGIVDITSISSGHLRGLDFKIFAPGVMATPQTTTDQLAVSSTSTITKGADLNGKTIGIVLLKSSQQVLTMAWVDKHGGDSKSLKFVELPFTQMASAVEQGRVDAVAMTEPFLTFAKHSVRPLGNIFDGIANRFVFMAYFATSAWLQSHAAVAANFDAAIRQAAVWANSNHPASAEILIKYSKLDPAIATTMSRSTFGVSIEPAMIQPVIDASAKYGVIEKAYPASDLIWQMPPNK
jgi:NitT/TauT family transport system substrate-binding protein